MKKRKIKKIILISVLIYVVFASIVIIMFNAISNDPIDAKATTYIRNNCQEIVEYGDIEYIGRSVFYKTIKEDALMKYPYTVETTKGRVKVYVTFEKNADEWVATSLEIIDIITN